MFSQIGGCHDTAKRRGPKLTGKFMRMCEVYRIFSRDWEHLFDYSEDSMRELNLQESHGLEECNPNNGFYWGKKYMDVTVKMWREDIRQGLLFKYELYEDGKYPQWWLDKVLKGL